MYPDILVIDKNNRLKGIIDVKLDLGWVDTKKYGFEVTQKGSYVYNRKDNKFKKDYESFSNARKFKYIVKNDNNEKEREELIEIPKQKVSKMAILLMAEVNHHNRLDGYKKSVNDAGFTFLSILKKGNVRKPIDKDNFEKIKKEIEENDNINKIFQALLNIATKAGIGAYYVLV